MPARWQRPVVEHAWTVEQRQQRQRTPFDVRTFEQTRYVCACGFATCWRQAAYIAHREATRHAHEGQQTAFG